MNFLQISARKLQDVGVASNRRSASLAPRLPPRAKSSAPARTIPTRRQGAKDAMDAERCWKNGTPQRPFCIILLGKLILKPDCIKLLGGLTSNIALWRATDNRFMDRQKWGPFFMPYITRGQRLVLAVCNWNIWKIHHIYNIWVNYNDLTATAL